VKGQAGSTSAPSVRRERARLSALIRHRGRDDPAVAEARQRLRVARAEVYIRKLVDEAPPLTDQHRSRLLVALSALLAPRPGDDL
jgi:hypothetical protein